VKGVDERVGQTVRVGQVAVVDEPGNEGTAHTRLDLRHEPLEVRSPRSITVQSIPAPDLRDRIRKNGSPATDPVPWRGVGEVRVPH
jgi:hypothetical protein